MPKPINAMEIFKNREKSNCQEFSEKTCFAFPAAVYQSRNYIGKCPKVDIEIVELYSGGKGIATAAEEFGDQFIEGLKNQLSEIDLARAVLRTGGRQNGRKLNLKVPGKDFGADSKGNFSSDFHINPWVSGPFLDYVVGCQDIDPADQWVSFRWRPDGELESTLNLFFDKTADHQFQNGSVFTICMSLALMFEKLSHRHASFQKQAA